MAMPTWDLMDSQMVLQSNTGFTFSDAYRNTGLSNSFQDLDDPAALLESLANFEHPTSGNGGIAGPSNDNFASLLQAATEAEEAPISHGQSRQGTNKSINSEQFAFQPPGAGRKRKRNGQEDDYSEFTNAKHPKRNAATEEEEDQLAREREIWGPEEEEEEESEIFEYQQTPTVTANARAVGVHSAAALFRRPSSASKKYTSKSQFKRTFD